MAKLNRKRVVLAERDLDKFQEAICTFANDLPNSRKNGSIGCLRQRHIVRAESYR